MEQIYQAITEEERVMTSISQLCEQLRHLFGEEAKRLARQAGLRSRVWNGASLLQVLVFGWLAHPQAGVSQLVRTANSVGISTSKQALDAHFTERTANWLLSILQEAVRCLITGPQVSLALMQRFAGVYIEDASTISLPPALASLWRGSGGNPSGKQGAGRGKEPEPRKEPRTEAALKLTVRWNLLAGQLEGPHLQAGRQHELHSVLRQARLPKGSLWIGDLGYFALIWLAELARQGLYFLIRYKDEVILWVEGRRIDDVLDLLPKQAQSAQTCEVAVQVGARKQVQARLLAQRVPQEVAEQRRARLRETARKKQKLCSERSLALCEWTLLLTNVPGPWLSLLEAMALVRARWQIELLFKLWKDQGHIDEWGSQKPWHILCELYAKLLAMLVQHWLLIRGCWEDPHHSLVQAAGVMRECSGRLLAALAGQGSLRQAVRATIQGIAAAVPIPARASRPSTSRLLFGTPFWGLT
jgi:hypothetical protein